METKVQIGAEPTPEERKHLEECRRDEMKLLENKGDGVWNALAGASVTPQAGYSYKARITPLPPYTGGGFEVSPIGVALASTTTKLAQTVTETVYEGKATSFTATVSPTAATGTVDFYVAKGSGTASVAKSVPLSGGKAVWADAVFEYVKKASEI